MRSHEIATDTVATIKSHIRCHQAEPAHLVLDEPTWRALPRTVMKPSSERRVIATRWQQAIIQQPREHLAETGDDNHVIKIVLRSMNIRLSVAGRTVQDGIVTPGMFHVTGPTARVRCLFRGPYDVLHLHLHNDLIAECARDMTSHQAAPLCSEATPTKDPVVERLGRSLLDADEVGGSFGQLYVDCISVAIVARLLALSCQATPCERPRVAELPRWRLKRAIEFIESRLAEPISLADVASETGLTRMHFAAQFRVATGLSPHGYLLRRRIERAQEMLAGTGRSVVDIALAVGFQNQSHFTAVFKRYAGQPPQSWRRTHGTGTRDISQRTPLVACAGT
jgi:AraC family transcriptional regulator